LKGNIVAAGPGIPVEPMTVKVGDYVIYGQYSGTEIKLDGATYLIMRESDVYGIVEE
jgi:chaperonin GroES